MTRDTTDFTATDPAALVDPLPTSEALVMRAHAKWLASLRNNDNEPSRNHQDAGWQLLRAMVDQLCGMQAGRFAYAVPCGGGKTQAVIALLVAMYDLHVFTQKTVLVVAQQVNALGDIKRQLIASGVPERNIGIIHSKSDAEFQSTGDEKRPIMLATHARIQRDGSLPECCRNRRGLLHDLVIWDEALISTEAVCLGLASTRTAFKHFSEKCPTVALAHKRLESALQCEEARQGAGLTAFELAPLISEDEAELLIDELRTVGHLDQTELSLQEQALRGASLIRNVFSLIDPRNGQSAGLMRYVIKVPDELSNIVILDASHAIDELRQADPTIRSGTTEAMTTFKDFCTVLAVHYPVASGRGTMKADRKAILEAVRIAKDLSHEDSVLFVTYKDWHERRLTEELQAAGISIGRALPGGKPLRSVITWGRHTSDNSYSHCKHVILVGLHRLPLVTTASQLAAQSRDLTHRRDKTGLLSLEQTVIAGEAMQAMNRGCMRLTDAEGRSRPMTAHIIAKDDLRPLLERAMPGLVWKTALVKPPTRTGDAANRIVAYLTAYSQVEPSISTRMLYKGCDVAPGKDFRAAALAEASIKMSMLAIRNPQHRWVASGRSLIRQRAE